MSDPVIVALITSITTTVGIIIQGMISTKQNRQIVKKVDNYHKEVNGKMGKLLITTKALGNKEGRASERKKQAKK